MTGTKYIQETSTRYVDETASSASGSDVAIVMLEPGSWVAPWMAHLHVEELPHGLFTRLGQAFVRRWHRAHLESPHGVGFVALLDGRPIGFSLGSTDRRANVAWLLRHRRVGLGLSATLSLLCRPRTLRDFVATRASRYARRLAAPDAIEIPVHRPPVAVLEAVVVTSASRGQGVGSALVGAFLGAVAVAGVDRVELVTKDGPGGAAGFYERSGWTQVGSHVDKDGDRVLTYRIEPLQGLAL